MEQCKLETVITTQMLLDKIPLKVPGKTILIEEAAAKPRIGEKIAALLLWFLPGSWIERSLGGRTGVLDDLATVIFSSGSTGEPKGVMLTHYNIASNIEQMGQTFQLDRKDTLLGVLPFFHSFGFTVTLWLPAVLGVGVAYHPSPLDLTAISEIVRAYRVTFLLATPTFLQAYIRRCSPEDFGSLEYVVVGAEKLPERLAMAFEDRFGIRPLEGYGCTECSPVVRREYTGLSRARIPPGGRKAGTHRPSASGCERADRGSGNARAARGGHAGVASGPWTERDAGLSRLEADKDGGGFAGWLVRHRRHRGRRMSGRVH